MDVTVFSKLTGWDAADPDRCIGHMIAPHFRTGSIARSKSKTDAASGEELFHWIALIESALAATDSFTMFELGAGYGRWTARAARLLRVHRPDLRPSLIAVEAEPTHFQFLKEHLAANQIDRSTYTLVSAPVTGKAGETVHFTVGHPSESYGQTVLPAKDAAFGNWPEATVVELRSTSTSELLRNRTSVDLIHMDIQGTEMQCVECSIEALSRKVRRLLIATHNDDIHERILHVMRGARWHLEAGYSPLRRHHTEFGEIAFNDGIEYWTNRRLDQSSARDRLSSWLRRLMPQPTK